MLCPRAFIIKLKWQAKNVKQMKANVQRQGTEACNEFKSLVELLAHTVVGTVAMETPPLSLWVNGRLRDNIMRRGEKESGYYNEYKVKSVKQLHHKEKNAEEFSSKRKQKNNPCYSLTLSSPVLHHVTHSPGALNWCPLPLSWILLFCQVKTSGVHELSPCEAK